MDEPRPARPVGRALGLYTGLRLLLFLVVLLVTQLFVRPLVLAVALAFFVSAVASIPLLAAYRADLNRAVAERARRRAEGG